MSEKWTQSRLYYEIVLPFSRVLESIEHEGFYIDREKFEEVRSTLIGFKKTAEEEIRGIAGNINLNSSKQVCELLYTKLGIPDSYDDFQYDYKTEQWKPVNYRLLTEKGAQSADVFSLGIIAAVHQHPVAKLMVAYRKVSKILSTYIEGIEKFIGEDSIIHPDLFQLTAGGRVAVSEPALAQLPSRTPEGKLVKKFFTAPEGYSLVEADYSGLELRFLAWLSNDPVMFGAFNDGLDVHAITCSKLFNISYEEAVKDKKRRYIGKTVNFTIIFGGSGESVQRTLLKDTGVFYDMKTCNKFIDTYFETYKAVKPFQNRIKDYILDHQYIKNLWGRYRYFPGVVRRDTKLMDSKERRDYNSLVNGAMRQGMSHMIQSSSSGDYGAYKTLKVDDLSKEGEFKNKGRLYFTLYDAYFCLIKDEYLERFISVLRETLEKPEEVCKIRLPVEITSGKNWFEL